MQGIVPMRRSGIVAALTLALAAVLLTFPGSASASEVFQFKETFGSAAQPNVGQSTSLAVDQGSGDLLVADSFAGTISRYKPDGTPDDFPALGTNVISETPAGPLGVIRQIAVDDSGTATDGNIYVTQRRPATVYIFAASGAFLGTLTATGSDPLGFASGVAVGPDGAVYVGDVSAARSAIMKYVPSANPPTNADFSVGFSRSNPEAIAAGVAASAGSIFSADNSVTSTYGVYKLDSASGAQAYEVTGGGDTGGVEPTAVAVAPGSGDVLVAVENKVIAYDASGPARAVKLATLAVGGSTVTGLAVGPGGEVYVARFGQPSLEVYELLPTPTVTARPASGVTASGATLNGTVNPEGVPLTACRFEYWPASSPALTAEAPCSPPAASIPGDAADHPVSAAVSGLDPEAAYRFRLVAANANGTETTPALGFGTAGKPVITAVRASFADQSSVNLEATIDPRGFDTSYRFEWGPTAAYGNSVPLGSELSLAAAAPPQPARIPLAGLDPASTYHYRVVAANAAGSVASPDQRFQTLNGCALPDLRCPELVSPRDVGPVALPGRGSAEDFDYQASAAPGGLVYAISSGGLPDATKGGQVLYHARRAASGWASTQLSPPVLVSNETPEGNSTSSKTLGLSDELSCGVVESNQPLTADLGTRALVEAGGANLYRDNPDGTYTAVTFLPPLNPEALQGTVGSEYYLVGFSRDCGKIVFTPSATAGGFRYAGVPGVTGVGIGLIYEWEDGVLRNAGSVPGPSGEEVLVAATPGGRGLSEESFYNAVSADGRRIFFHAERQTSPNPEEVGVTGVFVREDGTRTVDVSRSETATADRGATFWDASRDGSKVFFTANAGLTAESNSSGTDLYQYDLEAEDLTDLSVSDDPNGAAVAGVIGSAEDGSSAYFVARGQLLAGQGPSYGENVAAGTYSVYRSAGGDLAYVGLVTESDLADKGLTLVGGLVQRSVQVSRDGRYLLFQSRANVTGYESGGAAMAYLYDATRRAEPTVCVSCRQDGKPSLGGVANGALAFRGDKDFSSLRPRIMLTFRDGVPQVYFISFDRLAAGGSDGLGNIYEWSDGQVFHITTVPPGTSPEIEDGNFRIVDSGVRFLDASSDGTDLYFSTVATLNWEDGDGGRRSVYDARAGGGFAPPPPGAPPCSPDAEGSCPGPALVPPPAPGAGSAAFNGPGNKKYKKPKKKHGKCKKKQGKGKKQGKCTKKCKKKQGKCKKRHGKGKKQSGRAANGNRGAGR